MGHQTPGSSQCQYWGELGCPTPLEDPMLQPGDPKTWLCKAATAEWQRWEGGTMLGHTPAAMRKHGTPTPFLPHKAAPPPSSPSLAGIAPGGHKHWPQHSSAPSAGRAQWHWPAAETEEWLSLPAPE